MSKTMPDPIEGTLRKYALRVPDCIRECSGIVVFGKRLKSFLFSTDLSIIRNVNADALLAVYPFTPQPIITQALLMAADIPVFTGVGGGITQGDQLIKVANYAEMQGAAGVVVNAPVTADTISLAARSIDIPIVATIVSPRDDWQSKIAAGAKILNVSAAGNTPALVASIRASQPLLPIIATGGPTEESIRSTIAAGANAITWTPPSCAEILGGIMSANRRGESHF